MASPVQAHNLTYEDFLKYPVDGRRHEIINGEHFVSPSPNTRHQRVSMNLNGFFWSHCRRTGAGEVFAAPFDVLLGVHDVVEPDLIFVSQQRSGILTEKNIQGAPDLLVEILSPGTRHRDENVKRLRYEALGVAEYWLVEPTEAWVRVYRRADLGFAPPVEFRRGEVLATPLLPGLTIPLAEIFS